MREYSHSSDVRELQAAAQLMANIATSSLVAEGERAAEERELLCAFAFPSFFGYLATAAHRGVQVRVEGRRGTRTGWTNRQRSGGDG